MSEKLTWLLFALFSATGFLDMLITWAFLNSRRAKLLGFVEKNPMLREAVGSLTALLMLSAVNSIFNLFLALCLGLMFDILGPSKWDIASAYLIIAATARWFVVFDNIVKAIKAHRRNV